MCVYTKACVNKHPANLNILYSSQRTFIYSTDSHSMLLTDYGVGIVRTFILHIRKFSLCTSEQLAQGHTVKLTTVLHFRENIFFFSPLDPLHPFLPHVPHPTPVLPLAANNLFSVSMSLVFTFWFVCLDSTYFRDHTVFVFLCLTYST